MRMYASNELSWEGDRLRENGRLSGFSIVPDDKYPNMWRVRYPDGRVTDMVNRTRAKDAAQSILLRHLNAQETPAGDAASA